MATTRQAHTVWEGNLLQGTGTVSFDSSGIADQAVSWPSRAEQANGKTSPEELIAAAHSSCFSMALSHGLANAGTPPTKLTTQADVTFQPGTGITGIHLSVEGVVPGLDEAGFVKAAEDAKANCPVSQALSGTTITLSASLAS
ncbi:OsmC family protein [Streptomyces odonnellii]|uniref:OsmC family protein n=1 Tax=Streptomyces odonnellii TaxID=1417980 RepID=UPI00062651E0|nr:OsmC family protein [Streptomyces odonnellii]